MFFSLVALQLFFFLRIALMQVMPVQSTAFERTAAVELLREGKLGGWRHEWKSYRAISENLKRAVVASEDSGFYAHYGVEWGAVIGAWQHNQGASSPAARKAIRGGSTISQQLAKNLFLSSEQTYLRKVQELYITFSLELLLSKEQLLELYLNHAEWGKGIYGVQAAAQYYYRVDASRVDAMSSAMMASMLPRPRYYQEHKNSTELRRRATKVMAGIPLVRVP
ncbi:MAG: monofunctional biosynthetic peptidoglycan transglycosylase [Saezia sp.]